MKKKTKIILACVALAFAGGAAKGAHWISQNVRVEADPRNNPAGTVTGILVVSSLLGMLGAIPMVSWRACGLNQIDKENKRIKRLVELTNGMERND